MWHSCPISLCVSWIYREKSSIRIKAGWSEDQTPGNCTMQAAFFGYHFHSLFASFCYIRILEEYIITQSKNDGEGVYQYPK